MAGNLKHLLRHSGIYLIGNLLNRLGAFLLLPLYTNLLDTAEYGSLEILYSLTSVLAVLLGAGLSHATLRFYFDHDDPRRRNAVIITNFMISIAIAIGGCALAWAWDEKITLLLLDDIAYLNAFRLALLIIIFELTTEVFFAFIRAQEKSVFYVMVSAAKLVVQISATWYFLSHLDGGVEGVLTANLISVLITWLALGGLTFRHCGFAIDLSNVKPILIYSLPFAAAALINAVKGNADRFILKEYMGLEEVGIYG
jgi:O-antigen/teichoic acid export membrane protein